MSKETEKQLSVPSTYPHQYEIDTQFGDMDVLGHVNNLSVARYYESARARMHRLIFGENIYDHDNPIKNVLVENTTTFLDEVHYPQTVKVCSGIYHIGKSSYVVKQALFESDRCIGLCTATLVCTKEKSSFPISDSNRQKLSEFRLKEDL